MFFVVLLLLARNGELYLRVYIGIELCVDHESTERFDGLGKSYLSLVYLYAVGALELVGYILVGNRAVELGVSSCGIFKYEGDVCKLLCQSLSLCLFGVYLVLL